MPKLIDHDERREQLAEAAWRVILRDGVSGISVRTVAAEAGQSAGSLRHIFSNQADLLVFALRLVLDRVRTRAAALPTLPTAVENVEAIAAELIPLDRERRAEMGVYLALFTAANADADLRGPRDEAHRELRAACRTLIDRLDNGADLTPDADRELETARLHAVIDGLAAHLLYEPEDADPDWAHRVLVRHIRSLSVPER
ncbi:TetR/AcrR family transcriptional regulator [Parasphingorhabdus pacifica]